MNRPSLARPLLHIFLGLALGGVATAKNNDVPKADFDQGIDVLEILRGIKTQSSTKNATALKIHKPQISFWSLNPRFKADAPIDPREKILKELFGDPAPLHNRLRNYLANHQNHLQMQNLLIDPRMEYVDAGIRGALRAEGATLTSERDGMLPKANELDATDTALAEESDRLNENKRKLDERLAEIDRQGAQHERLCLPTHPPERHQWCVDNAAQLNRIIDAYNADVRMHNGEVAQWRRKVDELNPAWDAFVQVIRTWEQKIQNLIEGIQNQFRRLKDCRYLSGSSEIINVDPIQSKITCNYDCCGHPVSHVHFISGKPTQQQIDFICSNPLPRCIPGEAVIGIACHPVRKSESWFQTQRPLKLFAVDSHESCRPNQSQGGDR